MSPEEAQYNFAVDEAAELTRYYTDKVARLRLMQQFETQSLQTRIDQLTEENSLLKQQLEECRQSALERSDGVDQTDAQSTS